MKQAKTKTKFFLQGVEYELNAKQKADLVSQSVSRLTEIAAQMEDVAKLMRELDWHTDLLAMCGWKGDNNFTLVDTFKNTATITRVMTMRRYAIRQADRTLNLDHFRRNHA
jgi:hypothetical protein